MISHAQQDAIIAAMLRHDTLYLDASLNPVTPMPGQRFRTVFIDSNCVEYGRTIVCRDFDTEPVFDDMNWDLLIADDSVTVDEASYAIAKGQLVRCCYGRPETAWHVPDTDNATIEAQSVQDMGGGLMADAVTLTDGRIVLVAWDGDYSASIYASQQAIDDSESGQELELA